MLEEIYIDNYKCLTNFRIKPEQFQLWLGGNGSGKTSVFDALRSIQRLLRGDHVEDIFSKSTLTAWDERLMQTFEISLQIHGEPCTYSLIIEYARNDSKSRIKHEQLKWKNSTFFKFEDGEAYLYRINRTSHEVEQGTSFPADWSRSIIPTIAEREDNTPLIRFREEIDNWLLILPIPLVVKELAESETRYLSSHGENFAQWYRHIQQEEPGITYRAKELLEEVLPGFQHLSLREKGEARRLTATFRINEADRDFDFMSLSEGQRQIIVLYTILESLRQGNTSMLFIDEPENFVTVHEIRPWVDTLQEVCEEEQRQAIIISHHPEIVNKMARGDEIWFSRPMGAHTHTKPFPTTPGLTPAETMARGWEDE